MKQIKLAIGLLALTAAVALAAQPQVNGVAQKGESRPGIPGAVLNFTLPPPEVEETLKPAGAGGDVDLKGMARWAMNYLLRSPRPEEGYQPIFNCHPLNCPPFLPGWDQIVDGDTDCRMDWEFYYMRDISGCREGQAIEKAFHERIRKYLGPGDLCWTYAGCYDMDPSPAKTKAKGKVGNVWATTKLLKSLSLAYERGRNPQDKELARKVFEGLSRLAVHSGKYAWLEGGMGPVNKNFKPVNSGWGAEPPPIIEPLLCYWKATGDERALVLATAFAEGIIDRARPGQNLVQIAPDGSFTGHMHATLHAAWGIARLGVIKREPRYVEFSRKLYGFVLTHGTGTGWIHEAVTPKPDSLFNTGETCATSDMMSLVAWLAQADSLLPGEHYADYYDHLERYLRNLIAPAQFFITPRFEAFYRERHKDRAARDVEAGLASLRRVEGGIIGGLGPNDLMTDWLGDERTNFIMFGCCAPEGMRAIHTAWENVVRVDPAAEGGEKTVYVNMALAREAPEASVKSFMPEAGRLTVTAHAKGTFRLRPPAWAPKGQVKAWRQGQSVKVSWQGSYVEFRGVRPGEELTLTYLLASYDQRVAIWPDRTKVATFHWKGNMVMGVQPQGAHFPLYTGAVRALPPGPKLLR